MKLLTAPVGSVYPVQWCPNTHRGDYPHFAKRDAPVWTRWLALYAHLYAGFAYDVALGGADVSHIPAPEADRLGWQYSTALKIDACGLTDAEVWVFEVRPEATVSALGSAVCYTMVAQRDAVFDRPLVSAIVCESMQPDVAWACEQLAVRVFYV